jgi:LysM repeat protein
VSWNLVSGLSVFADSIVTWSISCPNAPDGGHAYHQNMGTEGAYYTVQTGDTLYELARRFGTTVEQLQAWNGIRDPNKINIGQRLIVRHDHSNYIPFPGAEWFKSQPNSPIISEMAFRLMEEGCSAFGPAGPSSRWTGQHRQSYAKWQRKLGYQGADADGWPGEKSWTKLRVPYPSEVYA